MLPARIILGGAAAALDRAVAQAIRARNRRAEAKATVLSHDERMERLATIAREYATAEPGAVFPEPPAVAVRAERVPRSGPDEVLDLSWPSTAHPLVASVRDEYVGHRANAIAHARVIGRGGRPVVIIVHGYLSGSFAVEERMWPIAWMARRGFDVALAVLPFHAQRWTGGPPPFPGSDPRFTNEGFRQAIADLRVLARHLRERGAPAVGALGMSLGGYTVSLWGTLDPDLAFVVPIIPLASIADFAFEQGRLGTGERAAQQRAALERANASVSPLARPPRIAKERVLVVGAESDRITPIAHAEKLALHFDSPLLRAAGGHLMQTWRREAFREVKALWGRLGYG
jgi:pimeloyl-ACP methyl ester carboxylesterase